MFSEFKVKKVSSPISGLVFDPSILREQQCGSCIDLRV